MLSPATLLRPILFLFATTLVLPVFAQQLDAAAIQTLKQKANDGDMQAQAELASRFHVGDGVTQNTKQAAFWYKKLAEKGVAEAQLTLGIIYIKGDGIEQNNQQALHWLKQAAEQRVASAQYLLGVAHAEGHGVEVNKVNAYMWYEVSAAMDFQNAIEARTELAKQMTKEEIAKAEQMATEWWMNFHH